MVTYKITNPDLFNKVVDEIDTSDLRGMSHGRRPELFFTGTLTIYTKLMIPVNVTGEHSPKDYERQYGFTLEMNPVL